MTGLDRLLDFAARSRVADGFGYLGADGTVLPDRPQETWIVARMTHVFGLAALLVRHGVEALRSGPLQDAEHGGWRSATDDDAKAAYVHAFVLLARPPAWLLPDAVALFDAAAGRGWAADGVDGFPYTLDWDDRPVVVTRMHWVLREAVAAAAVLARVTGEERYRELAARWRAHGEERFADPDTGSWHHELTPTGEVASGTWAGQPDAYHLAQMLLLEDRPVRGSIAAALLVT